MTLPEEKSRKAHDFSKKFRFYEKNDREFLPKIAKFKEKHRKKSRNNSEKPGPGFYNPHYTFLSKKTMKVVISSAGKEKNIAEKQEKIKMFEIFLTFY